MQIDLKSQKWLAVWLMSVLVFQTVVGFANFPPLAFITVILRYISILNFVLVTYLFVRQAEVSVMDILAIVYLVLFVVSTLLSGTNISGAIHRCTEILTLTMTFSYYRHYMPLLLKTLAITFSICVYLNGLAMILFPTWMLVVENEFYSFLLGGNYNQMGGRMLPAIMFNLLCIPYSRKWISNTAVLSIVTIVTLAFVGSMTSLTSIVLMLLCCSIPSKRLLKMVLAGLITFVLLFQCLIVFSGESLHDNRLMVYLVEEVLQKDLTFTYRTYLWDSAGKAFLQSPLLGYGNVDTDWYYVHVNAGAIGPHNFIYNVLLQGGVTLLSVLMVIIYTCVRPIINEASRPALLVVIGTVILFIMMLMEVYPFLLLFMLLVIMFYFPYLYPTEHPTIKTSVPCQK